MIRRSMAISPFARQWAWRSLAGVAGVIFVTAIILSPILMQGVLEGNPNLGQLSNIGQAYGGVSAVLSGLAFLGIAVSLILQRKEVRVAQLVTARERHFELVKIILERPELGRKRSSGESDYVYSKKVYANLWLAYWKMLWDIGQLRNDGLRRSCISLFEDTEYREWWTEVRAGWAVDGTRASRKFGIVVNQAYEQVVASDQANEQVVASDPDAGSSSADDTDNDPAPDTRK